MSKLLIFGGTTEGRRLASYFSRFHVEVHVCVATEYGEKQMEPQSNMVIFSGRMNEEEMAEKMRLEAYNCVMDTTHPYAVEVTQNIVSACMATETPYYRLVREQSDGDVFLTVQSVEEAVEFLQGTTGNIFVTTGSKELQKFTTLKDFVHRVYARVLPSADIILQCKEYGLEGKHLICMQGPFSAEMNQALLLQTESSFLVTKESGKTGGFPEKIEGAKGAGAKVIVIGRKHQESGYSFSELIACMSRKLELHPKRQVTIVGIGMGNHTLTEEAKEAIKKADLVVGAKRMVEALSVFEKETFISYQSEEIFDFLEKNKQYCDVAVAFSGDIGFYSGAKKLGERLENYEVKTVCGISSLSYFMGKLQMPWEDVKILSLHGKEENMMGYIMQYEKCFALLGTNKGVASLCQDLCHCGMEDVQIFVGERLSYEDEAVTIGTAKSLQEQEFDSLSVVLAVNPKAKTRNRFLALDDAAFLRGKIPMTKCEVRHISISKLQIDEKDVIYDIGAGTGSVSVEAAMQCPLGQIYAIEKKAEAVELLKKNREKFEAWNMVIVEGTAPESLIKLPPPNKVFIGGSSGNMEKILACVLAKNPSATVVVNAIALETLTVTLQAFEKLGLRDTEWVQISVSKAEKVGRYHMMKGQNPVWVISGKGAGEL